MPAPYYRAARDTFRQYLINKAASAAASFVVDNTGRALGSGARRIGRSLNRVTGLLARASSPGNELYSLYRSRRAPAKAMAYGRTAYRGRRRGTYPKKRSYRKRKLVVKKRRRRAGHASRTVVVGQHWPPSVMRYQGTTQVTIDPAGFVNDVTNCSVFTVLGVLKGSVDTFFSNGSDGTAGQVAFTTPRNYDSLSVLYENYRVVSIRFQLRFTNQNDFEGMKVYWWTNTETERDEPIQLMDGVQAKPGTGAGNIAPWNSLNGVSKILDQTREVSSMNVGAVNNPKTPSTKTVSVLLTTRSFTGPDRWGIRTMGGRFNTDGTGPGERMANPVASTGTVMGLAPQIHFAIVTEARNRTGNIHLATVEVKKTITVEFFNRVMSTGS